jgi:hypothetical protein
MYLSIYLSVSINIFFHFTYLFKDAYIKMFFNIFQFKYIRPSTTVQPINSVSISNSVPFGKQFGTLNCGRNGTELHKLLQIIHLLCHGGTRKI